MKVQNYILRLLSVLMLFCVFTTQQATAMEKEVEPSTEQPVFKELSHVTVVPHYDFSFGAYDVFFSVPAYIAFSETNQDSGQAFSQPVNSYMAKLLEHQIAINAP
jgi:hypothetical protein